MESEIFSKQNKKTKRMNKVLLGLVDLYLKTGSAIGSNTLKENGFEDLSSATIRNYFADLEQLGFVHQQHSSGGRIPTDKAFKYYAEHYKFQPIYDKRIKEGFSYLKELETKEVSRTLCDAAEKLSELTGLAVCISAPRFDQDFIRNIKLVHLDTNRYLGILITEFGLIQNELIYAKENISVHSLMRIELFLQSKLQGGHFQEVLSDEEEKVARHFYQEALVRYMLHYSHFHEEDFFATGFSKLLPMPEFQDPKALAHALALFEDRKAIRTILRSSMDEENLTCFVGEDLRKIQPLSTSCSVLSIPYKIHSNVVGSCALLGPMRLPYRSMSGALEIFSEALSEFLTRNMYTYKLQYRKPQSHTLYLGDTKTLLAYQPSNDQPS